MIRALLRGRLETDIPESTADLRLPRRHRPLHARLNGLFRRQPQETAIRLQRGIVPENRCVLSVGDRGNSSVCPEELPQVIFDKQYVSCAPGWLEGHRAAAGVLFGFRVLSRNHIPALERRSGLRAERSTVGSGESKQQTEQDSLVRPHELRPLLSVVPQKGFGGLAAAGRYDPDFTGTMEQPPPRLTDSLLMMQGAILRALPAIIPVVDLSIIHGG